MQRNHTPEQVIGKLADGDEFLSEGQDLAEVCRRGTAERTSSVA